MQSMASVAGQDKGEKSRSLSSSSSQRSFTSLRRFLVIFAGGNRISGEEGSGGMGEGCVIAGEDTSLLTAATATGEGDCTGASHAAVVAYPAVVAVADGTGRLQDTVMAWHPTWHG